MGGKGGGWWLDNSDQFTHRFNNEESKKSPAPYIQYIIGKDSLQDSFCPNTVTLETPYLTGLFQGSTTVKSCQYELSYNLLIPSLRYKIL